MNDIAEARILFRPFFSNLLFEPTNYLRELIGESFVLTTNFLKLDLMKQCQVYFLRKAQFSIDNLLKYFHRFV